MESARTGALDDEKADGRKDESVSDIFAATAAAAAVPIAETFVGEAQGYATSADEVC